MTRDILDRSIFEVLRLALVSAGYIPNITAFNNVEAYEAAKETMKEASSDKLITEIYGVGMSLDRGEIAPNKIVIDRKSKSYGTMGAAPEVYYEEFVDTDSLIKYRKYFHPERSEDVTYSIRVITDSTKWNRLLDDLIINALGLRRYIKSLNSNLVLAGEEFLLEKTNDLDVSTTDLIENLYEYTAMDVWLQASIEIEVVPQLISIQPNILTGNDFTGSPNDTIINNPLEGGGLNYVILQ